MNKHLKLLLFLGLASAFLGILYYITNPTDSSTGGGNRPKIYDELKERSVSFGKAAYDLSKYNSIKSAINGAFVAKELNVDEKNSLLQILEIEKSNSLIISFDEKNNSDCLQPAGLLQVVQEMKIQQSIINLPKIAEKINIYNNIVNFLNIDTRVNSFMSNAYNDNYALSLNNQINDLSNKEGVRACNRKNALVFDWRNKIAMLKNKDIYYKNIVSNPTQFTLVDYCSDFTGYRYYQVQLKCQ